MPFFLHIVKMKVLLQSYMSSVCRSYLPKASFVDSQAGEKIFLAASYTVGTKGCPPPPLGAKPPQCEADHPHTHSARPRMHRRYTSTPSYDFIFAMKRRYVFRLFNEDVSVTEVM
jgi:hypothetical protein